MQALCLTGAHSELVLPSHCFHAICEQQKLSLTLNKRKATNLCSQKYSCSFLSEVVYRA
jgi:hypothetical protein